MVHIGYFLLLLLCISANIIDGMEFGVSKKIKLEPSLQLPETSLAMTDFSYFTTDDDNLWKRENSAQSSTFDFFSASINIDNQSSSRMEPMFEEKFAHKPDNSYQDDITQNITPLLQKFVPTTKFDKHTKPQQSIPQNFLTDDNHSIVSDQKYFSSSESYDTDDECSTFFYRQFDDQGTLTPKQPPRKKRRVSEDNAPDDAHFTIICIYCSPKQKFRSINKDYLITTFQEHSRTQHKNIPEYKIKTYRKNNLQKARQIFKFSVNCPVPTCNHTADTKNKPNLKENLWYHVLKSQAHQNEKNNHSKESLAKYVNQNYTSELVPNPKFSSKVHSKYVC